VSVIVGGTETTSTTLEWLVINLCNNPRVMKKVQEEIDSEIGNRQPTMEDENKLKYLGTSLIFLVSHVFRCLFV